jgi:hypothetical protein
MQIHTGEKFDIKYNARQHEKVHFARGYPLKNDISKMLHIYKDFVGLENIKSHEKKKRQKNHRKRVVNKQKHLSKPQESCKECSELTEKCEKTQFMNDLKCKVCQLNLSKPKMSLSPISSDGTKLEEMKNENEIVKKERDKLLQSYEKLEQEVQDKNKTIESFEKSNIEAKCELEKLKHDKKVLKIVAESKNKTIESLKKSHSEAKREVEKLKHDEKILTEEVESKTKKIKALEESEMGNKEESSAKFKKIKELLATKIFLADSSNENLVSLLNDDIEKLFDKYDQIGTNTKDSDKLKDITETLADVKVKLSLQTQKRELYDKQFDEIMDILNLSKEARCIGNVLPALKELKESQCELQDQIETGHYSKAQSVIETFLKKQNSVN